MGPKYSHTVWERFAHQANTIPRTFTHHIQCEHTSLTAMLVDARWGFSILTSDRKTYPPTPMYMKCPQWNKCTPCQMVAPTYESSHPLLLYILCPLMCLFRTWFAGACGPCSRVFWCADCHRQKHLAPRSHPRWTSCHSHQKKDTGLGHSDHDLF